ncbi:MAG TPA: hypothetical protein VM537_20680 [Anaerolineae bacterium]|nr:hypothetical protein [Anaerolineae bacterium]
MVRVAVDGEPAVTSAVPTATPSTVKLTVPLGEVPPELGGLMEADNCTVPPTPGLSVDGETTTVGVLLETLMVTEVAVVDDE